MTQKCEQGSGQQRFTKIVINRKLLALSKDTFSPPDFEQSWLGEVDAEYLETHKNRAPTLRKQRQEIDDKIETLCGTVELCGVVQGRPAVPLSRPTTDREVREPGSAALTLTLRHQLAVCKIETKVKNRLSNRLFWLPMSVDVNVFNITNATYTGLSSYIIFTLSRYIVSRKLALRGSPVCSSCSPGQQAAWCVVTPAALPLTALLACSHHTQA